MAVIHPLRMPKKSWLIFFSRKLAQRLQGETNVWGSLSTWRKAQCQKDVICYLIFSYFSLSKLFQLVHLVFSWTDQMGILVTFLLFFVPCLCLLSWFYFFFQIFLILFLFLSLHFLSPFSFSDYHTGLSILFLCCIALPSYDWFLIPEAVLHTLSAPADLLLLLWCTFPFFLSPLPSL